MMLGLGDMAIPSMLLALVLCFDHRKDKAVASPLDISPHKGHKYIWYAVSGYAIGLVTALAAGILTHSPQPALLYLVENNPYDPSLMVFMDYRDYTKHTAQPLEAQYPTFLYAMPMSPTKVFFEVCSMHIFPVLHCHYPILCDRCQKDNCRKLALASRDAMPFNLLKTKLMSRLKTMGVRIIKTYEEEWLYILVGGSLPNIEQKNLAFGAAACMVHPATGNKVKQLFIISSNLLLQMITVTCYVQQRGYSVVRSLSEAPNYAAVIAKILRQGHSKEMLTHGRYTMNISKQAPVRE